jgi:hypothetical protein
MVLPQTSGSHDETLHGMILPRMSGSHPEPQMNVSLDFPRQIGCPLNFDETHHPTETGHGNRDPIGVALPTICRKFLHLSLHPLRDQFPEEPIERPYYHPVLGLRELE